jgi:hypothetical protein
MVEDIPLPLNYRYECHHGKSDDQKRSKDSDHATD